MFYSKLPGSREKTIFPSPPKNQSFHRQSKNHIGTFLRDHTSFKLMQIKTRKVTWPWMGARQMMNIVWRFHLEPSCHLKARLLSPSLWWADSARNIRRLTAEKPSKWRSGTATALLCRWEKEKVTALHQGPIPLSSPLAKNCFFCWFSTKKY